METQLLTAKQAQKILNVSLALVYRMAERKQLPSVRWECPGNGRKKEILRFKHEDIIAFIEDHRK